MRAMLQSLTFVLLWSFLGIVPSANSSAQPAQAQIRQPELMEGKRTLFKRVIVRPEAVLMSAPGRAGGTPLASFSVLYVYGTSGDYLEVGRAIGRADGYVSSDKVIEWKQTIVATFTNPADRQRSIMFRTREYIDEIVRGPNPQAMLASLREQAISGRSTSDGPVVALEPENPPDIRRNFYFFPILSEQRAQLTDGQTGRILEVASLTTPPNDTAPPANRPDMLKQMKVGIVFVVDTTKSMAPYIDGVRKAMIRLQARLERAPYAENIRFGLIGFRQNVNNNPGIEYHIKRFLPLSPSATSAAFVRAIDTVKEAGVPTKEFNEDALGGLYEATKSDWNEFQAKFIVLITDAGPQKHDEHTLYQRDIGTSEIYQLARSKGISIFTLHLLTPDGRPNHAYATSQYADLSRFEGGDSGYVPVPNGALAPFGDSLDRFADAISSQIAARHSGAPVALPTPTGDRLQDAVARNFYAMQLNYLGTREGTRPPSMFRAYVSDVDLSNPAKRAIGVRIFLTKNQLSTMYGVAEAIIKANEQTMDANRFFSQVRQAIAIMARDPTRRMDLQSNTLGAALGEFLEGLPYVQASPLLSMTEAAWRDLRGPEQVRMLHHLKRKRAFMLEWHNTPANWVALSDNVPDGERVTAYPLEQLP